MAIVLAAGLSAQAQQTTLPDASGRTIGTVTTDSNGTKTFRDGSGRYAGDRVAYGVSAAEWAGPMAGFRRGLSETGFVEGRNVGMTLGRRSV